MFVEIREIPGGGVTSTPGFLAHAVASGLKKDGALDLAVLVSTHPSAVAGVFTTNKVKAASVLWNMERVKSGRGRAVVVNSGNANACNGEKGWQDTVVMAQTAAAGLGLETGDVLVASTGVIGVPLPMELVQPGIAAATKGVSPEGGVLAARAIMTTDTVPKTVAVRTETGGHPVTIGAMAKGSGMIHPNMATMLGFITTDARITAPCLQQALQYAVARSFNMISVDGDTSTNDMVLVLANGQAQNPEIAKEGEEFFAFREALTWVCVALAKAIARDGEGATRLIEVQVQGAATEEDARRAARAVAASNLVKAAVYGRDANWGRVICALGYSGANFDPARVDISLGPEKVAENGQGLPFSEERARAILGQDTVVIGVDLKDGDHAATAWGCDLTYDYVKINASYRS